MKRIIFFMMPYAGHVFPNVSLLSKLLEQHVEIMIFGGAFYLKNILKGEHVSYEKYPDYITNYCRIAVEMDYDLTYNRAASKYYLNMYDENTVKQREYKNFQLSHQFFLQYKKVIEKYKPDIILYDTYAFFAKEIIAKVYVKGIEINCSLWQADEISKSKRWEEFVNKIVLKEVENPPSYEKIKIMNRKMNRLHKKLVTTYEIAEIEDIGFAYHCEELQDEKKLVHSSKHYMGIVLPASMKNEKDGSIYISRGTMCDMYGVHIMDKILQGIKGINTNMIVSLGNNMVASEMFKKQIYTPNIKIMKYANQNECLKKAVLYISHGGITGVREAVFHNTPVIVIPSNFPDYQVGKVLEKFHAGILIEKRPLEFQEIEDKVYEILSHLKEYTDGICLLSTALRNCWNDVGIESIFYEMGL